MDVYRRKLYLNILRFIFAELRVIDTNDIISIGKKTFLFQFLKSKFLGRKSLYALMPSESKVVNFENIQIKGELLSSRLIRSFISSKLYIQAINKIIIHSSVLIGPDVKIISANHKIHNLEEWQESDPIIINQNVWIGANSVILPGVEIGSDSIIGAGSVVTKSFGKNSIIAGNPAKLIKKTIN